MPKAISKHKCISRIDQPSKRTHGWYCRVIYKGKQHTKFFSDKKCGGKNVSLLSALAWRDQMHKILGKTLTERNIVLQAWNNTGVVGVRLNEKLNRYEVGWRTSDGISRKTSVSINKYGKDAAFKKACKIREEKEGERLGIRPYK